jgi:RNA polymerase sigma-70 factor (ECF subfamily)
VTAAIIRASTPASTRAAEASQTFASLYDREFDYVWRSLRRLGIPKRDLPDVTHDVFIKLHRNLELYDPDRPFRPWLFTLLFRVARDHLDLARNGREILTGLLFDQGDQTPNPEQQAAQREEWRLIDGALAALDLPHRVVLVMHDLSGHAVEDVARELALRVSTVYARLRSARAQVALAVHRMRSPR